MALLNRLMILPFAEGKDILERVKTNKDFSTPFPRHFFMLCFSVKILLKDSSKYRQS